MVNFCNSVIQEIRLAQNEQEVVKTIDDSFSQLEAMSPNGPGSNYILNMIINLQVTLAETLSDEARQNVKTALKIFRQYQKLTPGKII